MDILVTKTDHLYSYNMLWNNLVSTNAKQWDTNCTPQLTNKTLNNTNFVYTGSSFKKYPLKAKDSFVRNILNKTRNPYKLISKFILQLLIKGCSYKHTN
jgi:hypothetical protein